MLHCLDPSPSSAATSPSSNLKGRKNVLHSPGLRRITAKLWAQAIIVCLLLVVMLGASHTSRFDRVGHKLMCACGCGQVLLDCNHVGCPVSPGMIAELHMQMDGGGSDVSILNWFAGKYGSTVLAAPIRGGFDDVAWVVPIAVFFLATLGTGLLIWKWKLRNRHLPASTVEISVAAGALREQIRRETEY
jgi:cytochrome c-type biogenesis protein CcmH/NrfF